MDTNRNKILPSQIYPLDKLSLRRTNIALWIFWIWVLGSCQLYMRMRMCVELHSHVIDKKYLIALMSIISFLHLYLHCTARVAFFCTLDWDAGRINEDGCKRTWAINEDKDCFQLDKFNKWAINEDKSRFQLDKRIEWGCINKLHQRHQQRLKLDKWEKYWKCNQASSSAYHRPHPT